jgi:hypothetical protein
MTNTTTDPSTFTKVEINCETGEQVETPFTQEDIDQYHKDKAEFEAREAANLAEQQALQALKDSARAKLVAGEPLTEEEAATLVI